MKRKRYNEVQIINILKEQESGCRVDDICRRYEIGRSTFHKWKSKFGGMDINEAKRLRELEVENAHLKRVLADPMLDNIARKDVLSKKWQGHVQSARWLII